MSCAKILIVDDDEDMRIILEKILSKANYSVYKGCDGRECIEKAKTIKPDLIVMDIMMPSLDGVATVMKLMSGKDTKNIPIIICSNVRGGEDETVARNLGVVDYIRKSPQMDDLLEKVEGALKK